MLCEISPVLLLLLALLLVLPLLVLVLVLLAAYRQSPVIRPPVSLPLAVQPFSHQHDDDGRL